jgi:short subunit dehydrogenase-like uncharacterized protein
VTQHSRDHDLLVWGATGVAGRLVAEYLTDQYTPDELELALGGRSEQRLGSLADELCADSEAWEEIPLVIGDATDGDRLREIARETAVVCTTVGPYTAYGTPMVEACVEAGTDYCDLTGEVTWVREMIDRYHEAAVDAGARIVHSCGFDSVPADLGTALVQSVAVEEHGAACDVLRIYLEDARGGVSGGTLASGVELFAAAESDPLARETLRNPYALAPPGERDGVDTGTQRRPRRDALRGEWTAPSPMALVNERVVRRSNAVLDYPWGREFRCRELIPTGSGLVGATAAAGVTAGLGLATAALSVGPLRRALERFVFPDPGEGPTRDQIENGYFTIRLLGRGTNADGRFVVEGEIGADLDPGYGATARMLGESALCLVREEVESPLEGGVLTPASGIGVPLADRLRTAGLTVEVETPS